MANKNDKLVVAYYQNIPTATGAAQELVEWDDANDDIKLGAVAVMSYDPRSDALHTDELGARNTKKGALWGTAVGATIGLLTGGVGLIPGLIIGAGTGAAIGAVDHQDVVMTQGDAAEMLERLRHGAGAVAVMADDFEVEPVKLFLARMGGDVDDFTLPEETAAAVTAAAAAQITAAESVEESLAESIGDEDLEQRIAAAELGGADEATAKALRSLSALAGVSAADAASLHEQGVDSASRLLAQGATPEGRAELAGVTGIAEDTILVVVKQMDLMRIKGVGVKYASLLLTAGVDSVPDLARRNGANLAVKLADVNDTAQIVDELPSETMVADWVTQATELPRIVYF